MITALLALFLAHPHQGSRGAPAQRPTVGIVLFEHVQIIDFTGPYETFGQAGYRVYTAAASRDALTTQMGLRVVPEHTFTDAPEADVLVIPGGAIAHRLADDDPLVAFVRARAERARVVLTVCNGAFVLGPAGLARGKRVTTTAGMIGHLESFLAGATAVYDERFVEDGKLLTAGGLSAGIDAALHVIGALDSPGRAREVANKMEYDWDPSRGYARSKLADFELYRTLDFREPLRKRVLRYEGGEDSWIAEFAVHRERTLAGFAAELEETTRDLGWTLIDDRRAERVIELAWTFTDHRGRAMRLRATFRATDEADRHLFLLEISRAS